MVVYRIEKLVDGAIQVYAVPSLSVVKVGRRQEVVCCTDLYAFIKQ